ncbi:hypothetical protein [[Flexibacter] sp. ATCC 35103]|nr:hypothetical protein [[Flexibacter] sp. ATCC 35103]
MQFLFANSAVIFLKTITTLYINQTKNDSHYGLFIIERQEKNAKNSRQE